MDCIKMKAKKIYYSVVVGLQSLFILLLFVNIGYCIITSDLTMFPTTALYLNFYPFMNFYIFVAFAVCNALCNNIHTFQKG